MLTFRFAAAAPALTAVLCTLTCPAHAQAQAASAVTEKPDATHAELSEVIVTAQRRTQNLQAVPMSLSAINGGQLAERGIGDAQDLLGNVPGLSSSSAGEGRENFSMRGVATQAGDPVVGVYLDDVPLLQISAHGQTSAVEPVFFDLNRIEVLRGPQGTLYGAASMGGTLRYVTNQPDPAAFAAKIATEAYATEHGAPGGDIDAMVNVPISDRLAARVVGVYSSDGGYIDRLVGDFSGPGRTAVGPVQAFDDANGSQRAALRGLLRYDATPFLHITLGFFGQKARQAALSAYDSPPGGLVHLTGLNIGDPFVDNFTLPSLTIKAEAGPVEITSTTAYLRRTSTLGEDPTEATEEAVIGPLTEAGVPLPTTPFWSSYSQRADDREFTQELRISAAPAQPIQWVAGAFYVNESDVRHDNYTIPGFYQQYGNPPQALDLFGAPITPDNDFYSSVQHGSSVAAAVFADVTVPLTSRLKGSVGLRKFWDHSTFYGPFTGTTNGPAFFTALGAAENGLQPRAVLSYQATHDKMLYASFAEGFRPGGGNAPLPVSFCGQYPIPSEYQSDSVRNYEIGAKTRWLQQRMQLNVAAYHLIWDRIQQAVSPPCGYGYTVNAGRAESNGGELDYELALPYGFRIDGGIAYVDAKITQSADPTYLDKPPQNVAPWTGNFNLEYAFSLPANLTGYLRTGTTYVGRSYTDFTRDDPSKVLGDYFLTNLRLGVTHEVWDASIFVDNMFNRHAATSWYFSDNYQVSAYDRVLTNRPRSVGISFEYRFR